MDRFSRNQDQQAVAIYQLQRYGVNVVSATQPIPEGPIGTLVRNNYAFAAELELYHIRDRTTSGRKSRTQRGLILAAPNPLYGYVWADPTDPHGKSRYIPDIESVDGIPGHAAADVVKLIFELVLSGMKLRRISEKLSREGFLTPMALAAACGRLPKGRTPSTVWRLSTLRRLLGNPAYMGHHSGWRTHLEMEEDRDLVTGQIVERIKWTERAEDDPDRIFFSEDACPPLVTEEMFQAVQVILRRNREQATRRLLDPEATLLRNGFAVCGHCNRVMVVRRTGKNRIYRYHCPALNFERTAERCPGGGHSMAAATLDQAVWQWILHNFENPDVLRAKFDQWKAEQMAGRSMEYDRLEALNALIKRADMRRRNYMRSEGDADNEEMRLEYHQLALEAAKEHKDWTEERDQLQLIVSDLENRGERVDELVKMGTRALDHFRQTSYDDKRIVLQAFGVKVTVWNKEHDPHFTIRWRFNELHELWQRQQESISVH